MQRQTYVQLLTRHPDCPPGLYEDKTLLSITSYRQGGFPRDKVQVPNLLYRRGLTLSLTVRECRVQPIAAWTLPQLGNNIEPCVLPVTTIHPRQTLELQIPNHSYVALWALWALRVSYWSCTITDVIILSRSVLSR